MHALKSKGKNKTTKSSGKAILNQIPMVEKKNIMNRRSSFILARNRIIFSLLFLLIKESGIVRFSSAELKKMPLKLFDATVSTFDGVFEKFRSEAPQNKANLILFLADKEPATSLSWCPGKHFFKIVF